MSETKALIAMSGGVDSSVAAYLMQQAGADCIGATMQLCDSALLGQEQSIDSTADARNVAEKLGMPFHVLDHRADFRRQRSFDRLPKPTWRAARPIPV